MFITKRNANVVKPVTIATFILVSIVFGGWLYLQMQRPVEAADMSKFDPSNIMSDAVMSDKNSMTEPQIQAFLESKNPCNNTNISKASVYHKVKDGRFVCMYEDTFNGETAAHIIWQAAQDYSINPRVIIVLLQKEQGLITDTWPNSIQYNKATGYGCPDTAACDTQYYGLKNQIRQAANLFRNVLNGGWTNYPVGNNYVQYNPNTACGGTTINIKNRATSALYRYTPYQPNQSALNAGYGTGDSCGAYGNRNFWLYFTDWFGSTQGFVYGGIDYSDIFDPIYYADHNPDVKAAFNNDQIAMFYHFVLNGIYEGRQGNSLFSINSYRSRYPDLRNAYGSDVQKYIIHYINTGKREGRVATGDFRGGTTVYNGIDYSSVYNFDYYTRTYPDIWNAFGLDDQKALRHFVLTGIYEGRQGNSTFNVNSYRARYPDLRTKYGDDIHGYVWHYISAGKREGRVGI
jgi:hypothetical protein